MVFCPLRTSEYASKITFFFYHHLFIVPKRHKKDCSNNLCKTIAAI